MKQKPSQVIVLCTGPQLDPVFLVFLWPFLYTLRKQHVRILTCPFRVMWRKEAERAFRDNDRSQNAWKAS